MRKILFVLAASFAATEASAQMIITRGGPGGGTRMNFGGNQPVFEEAPSEYGVTAWRVGQFARYSISINMGQMPLQQYHQVSIVGQQGDKFWVETQDEMGGPMASGGGPTSKMLIPFGLVRERVGTETITMTQDSTIFRRTMVRAGGGGPAGMGFPASWTRVGEEQVTVVGGAFRAMHYRKGNENLWISAEAGPLGVVKYESDNTIIELTGKGTDARSRIPYGG